MFIYENSEWPNFFWDTAKINERLMEIRFQQGLLLGKMKNYGFPLQAEATLLMLTQDVLKSSEIEGEILDKEQVRSSIAQRLGIDIGGLTAVDQRVEGIVEMMFDATQHFNVSLTKERLFGWHVALFPEGTSGLIRINVGNWRDDKQGPMRVVSGPLGREKVHFQAPPAIILNSEMERFLHWYNSQKEINLVLKSALAHLWFVTLHPFDDGNGRIARAIADMTLAQSENSPQRFYSMSSQIRIERQDYYKHLEQAQKGTLDITEWLLWFLECLSRSIKGAEKTLNKVLFKAHFWERFLGYSFNERQTKMINRLLDNFEGKLTSSKWSKMAKCSQDTAHRDILDLIEKGVLIKNPERGRSTSYSIKN